MVAENQHETVAFLSDPGTHGITNKIEIKCIHQKLQWHGCY